MELFSAHQQWSTRPDDQRFTSLEDLQRACKAYAATAREKTTVPISSLRTEAIDGDVQLLGRGSIPARLTHWAFGQLCARVGIPASYARTLPATLAVQNLNHGLAHRVATDGDATTNLLFHENGSLLLRALTSDIYSRVWNWEIADRLLAMKDRGWDVARPDIRAQDDRLPLYASDHDLYAFIRHADRVISIGGGNTLQRGMIIENSEVGASKLRRTRFLYCEMCGNHIIWGAQDVVEDAIRHVGNIRDRVATWDLTSTAYLDSSPAEEEATIAKAQTTRIAGTKDQLLDTLFGKRLELSRKTLAAGYAAIVPDQDGDPLTVWGMVQGLTRYSQTLPYADARTAIDTSAGRILSMVDAF